MHSNWKEHQPKIITYITANQKSVIDTHPKEKGGNSLAVQQLELWAFTAEGLGSNSSWRTKILQAMRCSPKKVKKMESKQH